MPKYLTWEHKRRRWVFQIRIPVAVQPAFDGRTIIRKHLGDLPMPVAQARAQHLASHYQHLFAKWLAEHDNHQSTVPVHTMVFVIDDNVIPRFVATWRLEQVHALNERLDTLCAAPVSDWVALESTLLTETGVAREALRRRTSDYFDDVRRSIEKTYRIRLHGDTVAFLALRQALNAERVRVLEESLEVVRGTKSVASLYPDRESLLPLRELWGDPPSRLLDHWVARTRHVGASVNPRTHDKYRSIIRDLDLILIRRPVQSLDRNDVEALTTLWASRNNGDKTIFDKLHILRSLLVPFSSNERIVQLFSTVMAPRPPAQVKRIPFTANQLRKLLVELRARGTDKRDDLVLVMLIFLLAARIEEVYQLVGTDLTPVYNGWLVRIADHDQTGAGSARLKNATSARHLPLHSRDIPILERWLAERAASGGALFRHQSKNRYGIRSAAASKRLNRVIHRLFPDDKRLVLQSLRSTANRVMRQANVDPRIRRRFLGHADDDIHQRHYDPGELLDADDLESGSIALTTFLLDVLRT